LPIRNFLLIYPKYKIYIELYVNFTIKLRELVNKKMTYLMRGSNRPVKFGMYSNINLIMVVTFLGLAISALFVYFFEEEKQSENFSFSYNFNGTWLLTLTFFFTAATAVFHFLETGYDCVTFVDGTSRRFREYSVTATIMAYIIFNLNSYVLSSGWDSFLWCVTLVLNTLVWLFAIYRIVTRNLQRENGDYEKLDERSGLTDDKNWPLSVLETNDYYGLFYTTVAEVLVLYLGNVFGGASQEHKTLSVALIVPAMNYIGYWAETSLDFKTGKTDSMATYYIKTILAWLLYAPFVGTFIAAIIQLDTDFPDAPSFVAPLLILELILYTTFGLVHLLKPMFNFSASDEEIPKIFMISRTPEGYDTLEVVISFFCKVALVILTYSVIFTGMGDQTIGQPITVAPTTTTVAPTTTLRGTTTVPTTVATTMMPVTTPAPTQRELWESELAGRRALLSGECTYQQYITGMDCTNKAIMLHNHDFYDGTLTLDNGGYFKLAENIVFDPNADGEFILLLKTFIFY